MARPAGRPAAPSCPACCRATAGWPTSCCGCIRTVRCRRSPSSTEPVRMRGKRRSEPAGEQLEAALASPYWALEADAAGEPRVAGGLWQLPVACKPILAIVYRSAPRSAIAVLVLLVLSGVLSMAGLLATTALLNRLLASGATAGRVVAALPALALVAAVYSCRGAL